MGYQDFVAKINVNGFSIESASTGVKVSYEILIDELKPGVAEKIFDSFLSDFSDYGACDQRHKTTDFSNWYFFTDRTILIGAKRKTLALRTRRKVSFNIEELQYQLRFLVFPQSVDHKSTCSTRGVFEVTWHFLTSGKVG